METTTSYPSSQRQPVFLQILAALFTGSAAFLLLVILFALGTRLWYAGRIFPGVSVAGINVGGMTASAAAAAITRQVNYPQQGHILVRDPQGQTWLLTPAQLGAFLDPETSAASAMRIGRSGNILDGFSEQYLAWSEGHDLPPVLIFDQRLAYQYLASLGKQINRPVVEASLTLQGADVVVNSGQNGRLLDIPSSLALLEPQIRSLQDGVIDLVIQETPPVIVDVSAQAELAKSMLSQPLTLTLPEGQTSGQGGPWVFDQPTLASMLTIDRVGEGSQAHYQIVLDPQILRDYLSKLAPSLSAQPANARFTFNDDTHQLDLIQHAVTGRELNVEASLTAIQDKLAKGEHTIPMEFTFSPPPVTDESTGEQLGITELLHQETSYFYGSGPERVQNISAAAARFHGLLVAPGETFSMAQSLGDISLDNGFAEAMIIIGGRTVKGVGGGVCQVSTTLFRNAFFSGFPIIERHAHAYRVYYYEKVAGNKIDSDLAGLDATVFFPLVDLKFINDTPYWLLMETYVNPARSSITWKFYSTSDGRSVDWNTTGPVNIVNAPDPEYKENPELKQGEIKQVDWAADGADVTVNRTVVKNGAVYLQDTIQTHYQPWQAIFEYGPGTEIPTPESGDGGGE